MVKRILYFFECSARSQAFALANSLEGAYVVKGYTSDLDSLSYGDDYTAHKLSTFCADQLPTYEVRDTRTQRPLYIFAHYLTDASVEQLDLDEYTDFNGGWDSTAWDVAYSIGVAFKRAV